MVGTLLAGSEQWFEYTCREKLAAGDFEAATGLLQAWIERYGRTPRVIETENRQALLAYGRDPRATFEFLRERLGLRFNDQREAGVEHAPLPTRLDPALITRDAWSALALRQHPQSLDGFEDSALFWLAETSLDSGRLHELLKRLRRPDVPMLATLVVRDLAENSGASFGELAIHGLLRSEQLEECARLRPALWQEPKFVAECLQRLRPDVESTWLEDPAERERQLARFWAFAEPLPPVHNSLKAHVLYHYLAHDLGRGVLSRERFLAYLRLPHPRSIETDYPERFERKELVDPKAEYTTRLPAIGDDQSLLRACLTEIFASEEDITPYAEFLDAGWLRGILAETRLLLGAPDTERWTALLDDPARVQALEQRVEIRFPPTLRAHFAALDPVVLEVDTKNVPTLLVKVFEIDAFRYLVDRQRPVDETIELDGLVANYEATFRYDDPPVRRLRRRFELPILARAGTFVVEFVGNGQSSRAVIHKGFLRHVETSGAAGHVFHIFDEAGAALADATLWSGGREYRGDARGAILVPFSTDPSEHAIVLHHAGASVGERATLARFTHLGEEYRLRAAFHVDREALIAGATARLLVRPEVQLAGRTVTLALLTDPVLTIAATDLDGLTTTEEVRGLALVDEREIVHELLVPERLLTLSVTLRGSVTDLAGKRVELESATETFRLNAIDATADTWSVELLRTQAGYVVEARGKDGEPKPARPISLSLFAQDFRDALTVSLQTDAAGRIELGALGGIEYLLITAGSSQSEVLLSRPRCSYPGALQGVAGETLRVPYLGAATAPTRAAFSLLGQEHDAFEKLALEGGFLELRGLEPGDYELSLHESETRIPVRVARGRVQGDWVIGRRRALERTPTHPLQIRGIEVDATELHVALANATRNTRVTVVATRYLPPDPLGERLGRTQPLQPRALPIEPAESRYHVGRQLGDEYRYVLDRRYAPKFPGNMLRRPSLLLNPLDLAEAEGGHFGTASSAFSSRRVGSGKKSGRPGGAAGGKRVSTTPHPGVIANLDYLPHPSITLANLEPDASGLVRVPLQALGDGQIVHVLALDGEQAIYDTHIREERPLEPRARHLAAALDPREHMIEERHIEFVPAHGTSTIDDLRTTRVTPLDSLAAVHRLFLTISQSDDMARFAFVVRWPVLTRAEQLDAYARFACHELHFFLHEKDPAFFDEIVRPFLAQKLHKTFLDHWLLDADLSAYVEPWAFGRLNRIERILLARRLPPAEREAVQRLEREGLELRPSDPERERRLFELALQNDSLSPKDRSGLGLGGLKAPASEEEVRKRAEDLQEVPGESTPSDEALLIEVDAEDERLHDDLAQERADDAGRRAEVRNLYRSIESTRALVEHNYWHRSIRTDNSFAEVVPPSRFWRDYALAPLAEPFVSPAVAEATGSFLEMMFALAVLDLPFTAGALEVARDGSIRTLRSPTPLLLVRQERAAVTASDAPATLVLGENLLRLDDRTILENGESRDKFVSEEFLTGVPYVCQVLVTNPTSRRRVVELLLQIPAGALPVQKGFWTRGQTVALGPYTTQSIEYAFYFPAPGEFAHYPVHAAEQGALVAAAEPRTLHVVERPSRVDAASWEHVSQHGSTAEVLAHVDAANLQRLDLERIAWRLRERPFFDALVARLRARKTYSDVVWAYGLLHEDPDVTREYLEHAEAFLTQCGAALDSPLLSIDPLARGRYQHLELDPLVHARAHRRTSEFADGSDLARQYAALLEVLGYQRELGASDWAMVTYYQLLQDRVADALVAFSRIDPSQLDSKLQYDCLSAYLCFFTGDVERARHLAEPYREYPVAHWRERFREVLGQLDEAAGLESAVGARTSQDRLAGSEPALELAGDGRELLVRYKNLEQCEVRYYALDVEVAFSAQPFAELDGNAAAYVQPKLRQTLALPADAQELALALPAEFASTNLRVELRAGGLSRARTLLASALDVRYLEPYGQVVVTEPKSGLPLAKVYVKCFARFPDGTVRFHKDGYTDLRGRFDYASVSDDPDLAADRFAVLVQSDELGAQIRSLAPPAR